MGVGPLKLSRPNHHTDCVNHHKSLFLEFRGCTKYFGTMGGSRRRDPIYSDSEWGVGPVGDPEYLLGSHSGPFRKRRQFIWCTSLFKPLLFHRVEMIRYNPFREVENHVGVGVSIVPLVWQRVGSCRVYSVTRVAEWTATEGVRKVWPWVSWSWL